MTVTEVRVYPDGFGGWRPCTLCYAQTPGLATCASPDGRLILACPSCARQADRGLPPILPTGEQLRGTWVQLAAWHINGEIDDELVDSALAHLAPALAEVMAASVWEDLRDAVLRQAICDSPMYGGTAAERDEAEQTAQSDVDTALRALTGGAA